VSYYCATLTVPYYYVINRTILTVPFYCAILAAAYYCSNINLPSIGLLVVEFLNGLTSVTDTDLNPSFSVLSWQLAF